MNSRSFLGVFEFAQDESIISKQVYRKNLLNIYNYSGYREQEDKLAAFRTKLLAIVPESNKTSSHRARLRVQEHRERINCM